MKCIACSSKMRLIEKMKENKITKICKKCLSVAEIEYSGNEDVKSLKWERRKNRVERGIKVESLDEYEGHFKKGQVVEVTHLMEDGKKVVLNGEILVSREDLEKFFILP